MHKFKFFLVFLSLFSYLILAYLTKLILVFAKQRTRLSILNQLTLYLCRMLKVIGGVHLHVEGNQEILKKENLFVVATHIGYIDGIVMGSLVPGSFLAKREILDMPVIGKVVSACETIFVDSRKKSEIVSINNEMTERLQKDVNILIFPEGHCTDGTKVLPFYTAYFDAPLRAQATIVPVSIEYLKINGEPIKDREALCFFESMSFFPHLFNVLKFKSIDVAIKIHDKIDTTEYASNSKDRKFMSNYCHGILASYKKKYLPKPAVTPEEPEETELIEV